MSALEIQARKAMHLETFQKSIREYETTDDLSRLQDAISHLQQAIQLIESLDSSKTGRLADLGGMLAMRYQRLGRYSDLQEATSCLSLAVDKTENTDLKKLQYLQNLAGIQKYQYQVSGDMQYLKRSIRSSEAAIELTEDGDVNKPARLAALGNTYSQLYEHSPELNHLESSLSSFQSALVLVPDNDSFKMRILAGLGNSLRYKFEQSDDTRDLQESISHLRRAVDLAHSSSLKPKYLVNLGIILRRRHDHLHDPAALEESHNVLRQSAELISEMDPDWVTCIYHLGLTQQCLFVQTGNPRDIDDSIANLQAAKGLRAPSDPDLAQNFCDLALAQQAKFDRFGDIEDLQDALANSKLAVHIAKDGRKTRSNSLYVLGMCQRIRYEHLGGVEDIRDALSNLKGAVDIENFASLPERPWMHSELGRCLDVLYELLGEKNDLQNAIANHRIAIAREIENHDRKSSLLCNLAKSLRRRFEIQLGLEDLSEAMDLYNAAIHAAGNDIDLAVALDGIAVAQMIRFQQFGDVNDLKEAARNSSRAVGICDTRSPQISTFLFNLSAIRFVRFCRLDDMDDLNYSIANLQNSIESIANGSPKKSLYLSNLGSSLGRRFRRLGRLSDLDHAVKNFQNALNLTSDGNAQKPDRFFNLALAQSQRFYYIDDESDLNNSSTNLQKALYLTEPGGELRPHILAHMGKTARMRYDLRGNLHDLYSSITNLKEAIQSISDAHPAITDYYVFLGQSQQALFSHSGNLLDLDEAIGIQRTAMGLTDSGDPKEIGILCSLGALLCLRFDSSGLMAFLDESQTVLQRAVNLASDDDPIKGACLLQLGNTYSKRFKSKGDAADHVAALSSYQDAAKSTVTNPKESMVAAGSWAYLSYQMHDLDSALMGYRTALEILPRYVWLGLDLPSRQNRLSNANIEELSCNAAYCAIRLERFEEAVEIIELGRSILWQQASSLRSDLQVIREKEPKIAEEFESISRRLEAENLTISFDFAADERSKEDVLRERRELVDAWERLVEKIRQLPDLTFFLKPVPFAYLRRAASSGHIIAVNVSRYGVDALVFNSTHNIEHISLPDTNRASIVEQVTALTLRRPENPTGGQRDRYLNAYMKPALRAAWDDIVVPIFEHMQFSLNPDGAPLKRVWWYLTGPLPFLPIHAAGPGSRRINVSALVISSYIPTLASLLRAQKADHSTAKGRRKLLTLSQTSTPGQTPLPQARNEVHSLIEVAHQCGWPATDIIHLEESSATCVQVLEALETCTWVHFACHGLQDMDAGIRSSFALHDGALELNDIVSKRLLNAQFAFLSVCHAASGMRALPGEAMHLAGGMQFAGFSGVVATMWAINDEDAPTVARYFYQYMLRDGIDACHSSNAAAALNYAVMRLRVDHHAPLERWAPFIHLGL
ncbi:hypothetical protein HWV62_24374 [Athelia sp. TMB]|nr:hypothetical protein HWV62_24374 [Athelia sp. TMB]